MSSPPAVLLLVQHSSSCCHPPFLLHSFPSSSFSTSSFFTSLPPTRASSILFSRPRPLVIHSCHSLRDSRRHIDSEWYPADPSTFLETLRGWGLPLALGAMLGSFLSCKLFVLASSFCFLAFVVLVKTLEGKGEPFTSIALGLLSHLPIIVSKIVARFGATKIVPNVTVPFHNVSRKLIRCIPDFLSSFGASITSALPVTRVQAAGIRATSSDSVVPYIEKCFVRVKNLIQVEEANAQELDPIRLDELKETLNSLRESLENLSLTVSKQSIEKPLTICDKNDKNTGKEKSVSIIELDGKYEYSETAVLKGLHQSPHSLLPISAATTEYDNQTDTLHRIIHTNVSSYSVGSTSLDMDNKCNGNDDSKQVKLKQDVLRPEKRQNDENTTRSRYPDYWLQDDAQESMTTLDTVAANQNKYSIISTQNENLYANRENFWLENPQNREKCFTTEDESESMDNIEASIPIGRQWCNEGQPNDSCPRLPAVDDNEENRTLKQQNGENKEQISLSQNMETTNFKDSLSVKNGTLETEFNVPALDSMKELTFNRESPSMPATTEEKASECQKLINEGEVFFHGGEAGLNGKIEVGKAESLLYRAADKFSTAAAIDPSNIEATGFWGNTHLVHGKLQLRLSRELRFIISSSDTISSYQVRRQMLQRQEETKWVKLEEKLQVIGKECEEHFIQAGRKYRQVLSIHNRNIPALYNWGLALFLRAQLVAAEQDASEAADRIYMAAIDKFEAMMGISQEYVPEATLNWGLTLRARSRLRPMNNPERIDLLIQAKQLLEDAQRLQHHDAHLYGIIIACNIELQELQKKETKAKKAAKFAVGDRWKYQV